MVANAQMIALRLDVAIHHLIVEKLGVLGIARNPPVVVIEQAAEEPKLPVLLEHFNLYKVGQLASEGLHPLVEPREVMFDLGA